MASTGKNDGGVSKLSLGGTTITHLINCTVTYTHDPREVTTKDSTNGAKEFDSGLTGWTMSGEAYLAEDAAYGYNAIQALAAARTKVEVVYLPASGDVNQRGTAMVSNCTRTAGNTGENESFTVEIQGTGTLAPQITT